MGVFATIRRAFSRPAEHNRPDLRALMDRGERSIRGRYDAASEPVDMVSHWAVSDCLDADMANSLAVRKKLRNRSRLERANNAYAAGMIQTHANVVVGVGPSLRMQTGTTSFNQMVEAKWALWCKATGFLRKLRTMHTAKTGDGEGFGRIKTNPAIVDQVKIDVHLMECDQVSSAWLPYGEANHIDGVWFDEFGNPVSYDVLPYHPGSSAPMGVSSQSEKVEARFMLHWFRADRPGQHRGIPEITPALMSFAQGRRWREAVIAAAETAADFAAVMEMGVGGNQDADVAQPFTTMPIEKRMFVASPAGAKMQQLKAEQPATGYEVLNRSLLCEQGRPLGMSYVIAALDSSASSFSGGKLDQLNYRVVVNVDRADGEAMVLDRLFALWFFEAVKVYGWTVAQEPAPKHSWDWPGMPQIDDQKTATARKTSLSCGVASLGRFYAEDGLDFEDEVAAMAAEYGIDVEEMKARILDANFPKTPAPEAPADEPSDEDEEPSDEDESDEEKPANDKAKANGHVNRLLGFGAGMQ